MGEKLFTKTKGLVDRETHYCPGCTHGIIHRLVAEVLEEMNEIENSIVVASVGCSVFTYEYFNMHGIQAAHGRAPATATGVKRVLKDKIVFTYQGDGDLASIGAAEIVHSANRGENITVIYVNNAIYGMTGGQMSPTTLLGQKTTTTPFGREFETTGAPLKIAEMLSTIDGVEYIERTSTHNALNVRKTKKAIKKAFENQKNNKGFSLVEILSSCNIGWGMTGNDALKWIETDMIKQFPLGVFKDGRNK